MNVIAQITQDSLQASKNNIFVGLNSQGSFISAGYEFIFEETQSTHITYIFGLQIGYNREREPINFYNSSTNIHVYREKFTTLSGHFTFNMGLQKHKFEIGFGAGSIGKDFAMYPILGYRLMPLRKNNISLRITANYPIFITTKPPIYFFPIGINLGVSF